MKEMTPESFTLFHLIQPQLGEWRWHCHTTHQPVASLISDLLVLGTGSKVERVDPAVMSYLQRKGISVEVQDTVSATSPSV